MVIITTFQPVFILGKCTLSLGSQTSIALATNVFIVAYTIPQYNF